MDAKILHLLKDVPEKERLMLKANIEQRIKNPFIAFCLNAFLGFLGMHHFYLENVGYGFLYLFTGGFFGIFWFFDFFLVWSHTKEANKSIALKVIKEHSILSSSSEQQVD